MRRLKFFCKLADVVSIVRCRKQLIKSEGKGMLGNAVIDFEKSSICIDHKLESVTKLHSEFYNKFGWSFVILRFNEEHCSSSKIGQFDFPQL